VNITDRGNTSTLIGSFTAAGATAPKALIAAHERTMRLSEGVRGLSTRPEAIFAAVAAALERGEDPAAAADVVRILTSTQIQNAGVVAGVDDLAFDGFREAAIAHTDAIIAAWRKPFDAAAAVLADAHQRLGNVGLEDTSTVIAKGADAADVWAKATAAVKVIEAIRHGWLGLVGITRAVPDDRNYTVLRIAAIDHPTWTAQQFHGRKVGAWDAVLAGLTLALPTPAEYKQRVAVITQGTQQAATEREEDERAYLTGRRPADREATIL